MMKYLLFVVLVTLSTANLRFKDMEQLQEHHKHFSQEQNGITKVHLIPHSHDDVGWLKTVDQYFYGLRNDIQWASVEYVIDSYIAELLKDQTKRFIQVETAFFKMWWDVQSEEMKTKTKALVKNGQLEFISGGWCMNDEATPYYEDIIDQMTLGHKFLLDTFNVKPTVGWQIDPFGHSSTQASFSSQMGFNAWFFARIDYQDKELRYDNKELEMILIPSQNGQSYPIFTHVQYYHYEAPPNYNFDARRDDSPIVDDPNSDSYNLPLKAQYFAKYFQAQASHYQGNQIMHTLGSDFLWSNAAIWYKNLDKLINYLHEHKDTYQLEFEYSTPSRYIEAVNKQDLTYKAKTDDFFPYADRIHAYWTGYFTSRVAFKGYTKRFGRQAQVYRKFISYLTIQGSQWISKNQKFVTSALKRMDEALAIAQHHDAVSGTAKQAVNEDYLRLLARGENEIQEVVSNLLDEVTGQNSQYEYCNWNSTICDTSYKAINTGKTLIVTVIDGKEGKSGARGRIRVQVPPSEIIITDQSGSTIEGDIFCQGVNCDLFFVYTIPADNVVTYFKIKAAATGSGSAKIIQSSVYDYSDETYIQLTYSRVFRLRYAYYKSDQSSGDPSGAYLFRTVNGDAQKYPYGQVLSATISHGAVLSQITIQRTYTKTTIRKYKYQTDIYDIETFVDSIPVDDKQGKEIVMIIETGINNNQIFYTDSNGLEMQKRVVNFRPTWDLEVHEQAAGNYYPYNGAVMIKDSTGGNAAAVINDRSQGTAVINDGFIEIMIHRRCLKDDQRGVDEALNEKVNGKGLTQLMQHSLIFYNSNLNPNAYRSAQLFNDLSPIQFLSINENSITVKPNLNWQNAFDFKILNQSGVQTSNAKVFVQYWNENQYLVRIQNFQESGVLTVVPGAQEMIQTTMTGNQLLSDWYNAKLTWKYKSNSESISADDNTLAPLQIRTYLIKVPSKI